jgi:hypothetical protein
MGSNGGSLPLGPEAILKHINVGSHNILNPANGAQLCTFSGYGLGSILYDQRTFVIT